MTPRLKEKYNTEIRSIIAEKFGLTNVMQQPKLEKIVISVGLGKQLDGTKIRPVAKEQTLKDLEMITGQKAIMKRAKKSVSNFKLRAGYEIGSMVTLRGDRMWEFLDRLISLAIPRIKDFRGLPDKAFDGRGNYNFGVQEQGIFPEIDMANASFTHGMNITMVFKKSTDDVSREVLTQLGMPFVKRDKKAS
ncbi:50S ribosomal protein L5 [Poriferisphaera sp. WC338]|uniref:50S ribosomal protein L5 n=1 Tax=Poriferisphaera sp. WC338 TaxID=3425129 RepID=UPI003D815F64